MAKFLAQRMRVDVKNEPFFRKRRMRREMSENLRTCLKSITSVYNRTLLPKIGDLPGRQKKPSRTEVRGYIT